MIDRFFLCSFFAIFALKAAPIGNTAAPFLIHQGLMIPFEKWMDLRGGYEGDFVADGRMKQYHQGTGRVDNYEQTSQSGTVSLNLLDRIDFYTVLGASQTEADWRFENSQLQTVNRIQLETGNHFLWAVGMRAILWEWNSIFLGGGGRYSFSRGRPFSLTSNGMSQSVSKARFFWEEWQVHCDLACQVKILTPYIGIKYLHAETKLHGFLVPISSSLSGSNSFKNRIPVGLYLGCAVSSGKYFMCNLEGRLLDEEAITLSADFRF